MFYTGGGGGGQGESHEHKQDINGSFELIKTKANNLINEVEIQPAT